MSDGTSNPIRYFGQHVRRARLAAGWTLAEFGQRIGYDPGQISRIENGKRPPTELFAQMCDRAFPDRGGWFSEFYAESRTWIATPPWFRSWVENEQHAATLRLWQPCVLSGLLQTEEYTRALIRQGSAVTEEEIVRRGELRASRQEILRRPDAPQLWAVVDEGALRRPVGGAEIVREQLKHLIEVTDHPAVTLQVLPFEAGAHAAMGGPFTILRFAEPDLADVVYIEQLTSALYLDKPVEVDSYLEVMEQLCLQAEPAANTTTVLSRVLADI